MTDFPNALPKEHRLHEYEIVRVLGVGGFGVTYLALDDHLNKPVAIKEYLPNDLAVRVEGTSVHPKSSSARDDFQWGLDRFLDEARTLARFDHPSIIRVIRFFEANDTAYIVMEYAEGRTFADYLREHAPLDESDLKAILLPLLDGLQQVHQAELLHRDIKPDNIILRATGEPVLIDFGAARQQVIGRSRSVSSIISPGYSPHEQYSTRSKQGPWTDIYALGAVCYAALTGRKPPDSADRVRNDPMVPATKAAIGRASTQFLAAVDHALEVFNDQRPQSIEQWRANLEGSAPEGPGVETTASDSAAKPTPKPSPQTNEDRPEPNQGKKDRTNNARYRIAPALVLLIVASLAAMIWVMRDPSEPLKPVVETGNSGPSAMTLEDPLNDAEGQRRSAEERRRAAAEVEQQRRREIEAAAEAQRQLVLAVQTELKRLGRDVEVDGVAGDGTRNQILAFERAIDRTPRGEVSQAVLDVMKAADRWPGLQPGERFRDCDNCPEMVFIPAGSFQMGSPEGEPERQDNEGPQRQVRVPAFALARTEVTFAEWDACVADGGCSDRPGDRGWGRGNRPVTDVSWTNAQEYIGWLSRKTSQEYRLPSEAEWEYAARAGTTSRFNKGNCIYAIQANFDGRFPAEGCPRGEYRQRTEPVGSFSANQYGLHDMHGNVGEWVQDCWNENYRGAPTDGSAWMSGDCGRAVMRGGSWYSDGRGLRSAYRFRVTRDTRRGNSGFRPARSVTL